MYGLESIGHVFVIGVALFLGILLLLMPLFVWQLRNIAQSMNRKMTRIVDHLDGQNPP